MKNSTGTSIIKSILILFSFSFIFIFFQLNKTLNPKLCELWRTRDWDHKVRVFSQFLSSLQSQALLCKSSRALCIGARIGQEVIVLRTVGVADSIGMDLVPSLPLVVEGDFHRQPFDNWTFDFKFSNVFDHALYPEKTLKPGGVCVSHVALVGSWRCDSKKKKRRRW